MRKEREKTLDTIRINLEAGLPSEWMDDETYLEHMLTDHRS